MLSLTKATSLRCFSALITMTWLLIAPVGCWEPTKEELAEADSRRLPTVFLSAESREVIEILAMPGCSSYTLIYCIHEHDPSRPCPDYDQSTAILTADVYRNYAVGMLAQIQVYNIGDRRVAGSSPYLPMVVGFLPPAPVH
jgi:hypothetical protein